MFVLKLDLETSLGAVLFLCLLQQLMKEKLLFVLKFCVHVAQLLMQRTRKKTYKYFEFGCL